MNRRAPVADHARRPAGIDPLALLGTAALALPFVVSAIAKAADFPQATGEVLRLTGLAGAAPWLAGLTIAVQMLGSLLLFGPGAVQRAGIALLAGFTLVATGLAHDFWAVQGPARAHAMVNFAEHLGLIAGLFLLAGRRALP